MDNPDLPNTLHRAMIFRTRGNASVPAFPVHHILYDKMVYVSQFPVLYNVQHAM